MTRALDWDIKIGGKTYMLDEVEGARSLRLGKEPKEPGAVGQLGTIIIPSFHHGFGQLVARDPRACLSSNQLDTTIPGVLLPAGLDDYMIGLTDSGSDNWYGSQGGGACTFYYLGNPANEEYILFVTAKRIIQLIPSTEATSTVYTLDATKYAFTGSWAKYKGSIYFGVESNETGDGNGYWGNHIVHYNVVENTWGTIGWVKGSLLEAAKGKLWWVENRGLMGVPQVYWTDDTTFPVDPTPVDVTYDVDPTADDGLIKRGPTAGYPPSAPGAVDTAKLACGQQFATPNYSSWRGYVSIDTSGIPDDASVTVATLRVYLTAKYLDTNFLLEVRKHVWSDGGLQTSDWASGDETLIGSIDTSTFPAINNWVEIPLTLTEIERETDTEFYFISKRERENTTPTNNEYVEFEDLSGAAGHEPEIVIKYSPRGTVVAGPFPLESGGYATETSVLGPYVLTCKQDGEVYGVDEEGRPAPIIGPGLTTPGTRFGKGAIRFGEALLVPHSDGLLSIGVPSLEVKDIHPANLNAMLIQAIVGGEISSLVSVGPRLFALAGGAIVPILLSLQSYEDGDFWAMLGPATTGLGARPYGMAITKMSNDTLRVYYIVGGAASGANTRIGRTYLPTLGWGTKPSNPASGGILYTSFYLGEGETGPVTKRFIQVRGFAQDVDTNNYFTFKFLLDNPAGAYTDLTTVKAKGPFSLPFPASVASLGRSVSLQVLVTAITTGTIFPRLELPIYIDFEYVPQSTDVFTVDVLCSDKPLDRRGGQRLSDAPQTLLNALDALVHTVTTLEFRGNVGSPWNVLVEKMDQVEKQMSSPQEEPATIARLQIRRL